MTAGRAGRVAVAMSGGVDSSTAAALLLEKGYEVFGLTMRTGYGADPSDSAQDAARALGIECRVIDVAEVFEERVVGPFCHSYLAGTTPNPCLGCNRFLKFGELLRLAREMGAGSLATGHYARVEKGEKAFHLRKAVDRAKDQSYVLYILGQEILSRLLLPIGDLDKTEVREKAQRLGLPSATRPESQDICFIDGDDYAGFIERWAGVAAPAKSARKRVSLAPGPIRDLAGRVLGTHHGLWRYTVGQRRGLGLTSRDPLYVVAIDPAENTVIVGPAEETLSSWLVATGETFVSGSRPAAGTECAAKVRYRSPEAAARLTYTAGGFRLDFSRPQRAVAPGQAAVVYDGDEVLGGGTITVTEASERILG